MSIRNTITLFILLCLVGCGSDRDLFGPDKRHQLWLTHKGADLPITVQGNTESREFCILLHGGPGGSAQEFNAFTKTFTDQLEDDYAMVYYDQRYAGLARGEYFDEYDNVLQHVEDLDLVIDLLFTRYGDDIAIALMGHSWGGYLSCAYVLDPQRAARVTTWVNIDGGIHRTNFLKDDMQRIVDLADEEIGTSLISGEWADVQADAQNELNKNVSRYTFTSQNAPFRIVNTAERIIESEGILDNMQSPYFQALYTNNYQPFIASVNGARDSELIQSDMFIFDDTILELLPNVTLPVLNIYGYWDVRTALHQGEFVMETIATPEEDKSLVILDNSGHSPMINEPILLANSISDWLDKYF